MMGGGETSLLDDESVRRRLKDEGEVVVRERALHFNDGSVRTVFMAGAFREYDENPERATQIYDPVEHAIIIDLPDPETEGAER